jgi:hypothetical protein
VTDVIGDSQTRAAQAVFKLVKGFLMPLGRR